MEDSKENCLILRGRKVRIDSDGFVSLNDIHRAGGFSTPHQSPTKWRFLDSTKAMIVYVLEQTIKKSDSKAKIKTNSVYYVKEGKGGGSWAHPNLALAYAKYLSPALHYEVNEVYLRFKAGDATLADETLQRASPEDNEWAARRAMGRVIRNQYTRTLDAHGVKDGFQFGNCTNETYLGLFDKSAKDLKEARGIKPKANLRDNMSMKEIAFVAAAEALSVERMEDEKAQGYSECRKATAKSSRAIRAAIDSDRKDRSSRLV